MLRRELEDEESSQFDGELMIFFCAVCRIFSTAGRAAASAEVTSTDRSGFAETAESAH